jgi:hypothetical protein
MKTKVPAVILQFQTSRIRFTTTSSKSHKAFQRAKPEKALKTGEIGKSRVEAMTSIKGMEGERESVFLLPPA